jgi:hypothetical protein
LYAVPIAFAALVGFLGGLLSFKVKTRWCSRCGAVKRCPECAANRGAQPLAKGVERGYR